MNTQIYVLDRQFQPVPVGVIGEIHIGGEGVARGYLNHPDLTAERFVPDPFSRTPGARLYRTSDMARFLVDGQIEFIGRRDQQVKLRGFRIEPGEIETVLGQHPGVRDAVVVAREDTSGGKRLIAYVVVREEPPPATSALRDYLRKRLPEYMVPASFLVLESLPLTATGKIDRNALPVDEIAVVTSENYLAPRTAVEKVLAGIFSEMLSLERVSVDESFFDLGGHSLLATQVLSRVREAFQVELPLRKLFKTPTVAGLAADILEDEGQRDRIEHTAELLLKLTSLSDKEVDDLLAEKIGSIEEGNAQ
jgi:acyl carrier protein